ncbi:MAG: MBOAT family O-acyltransferase [Thermoguttaceae bacterium]
MSRDLALSSYAMYLINWFWLVLWMKPARVPAKNDIQRLIVAGPAILLVAFVVVSLFSLDWSSVSFAVEHSLKVSILVFAVTIVVNTAASVWRLLGGTALDPMDHPAMARTPADFWRRWNRPAQQFFYEYAFLPTGGMRNSIRGTLCAFAVSGLVHEYVFGIATGYIHGWQILYFMLQGVAVAMTKRFRPRGWIEPLGISATIAFNLFAAVLFFKSVDGVFHFYSTR